MGATICSVGLVLLCPLLLFADMAIIRPFAPQDKDGITASFVPWEKHIPCNAPPTTPVDLFLCYSQSYANEPELQAALEALSAKFTMMQSSPGTWQSCFRNLYRVEANLLPEHDIYDPKRQNEPSTNWVEGPNRQFLFMAQAFQKDTWGHYATWYLMEMDSVPVKTGWMDTLLAEVNSKAPFSILGSLFRSGRWDAFRETLPPSLLLHINGNAVYNCSHPLFNSFLNGLEEDAVMGKFRTPFDVRISELFLESTLTEEEHNSYHWDSSTIGNYASATLLPKFLTTENIVHGARFFSEWEEDTALIVSDWGLQHNATMSAWEYFRYTLQRGQHPFREIIVIRPTTSVKSYLWPTTGGTMTITEQPRVDMNRSEWVDWCNVKPKAKWFMYTNVNFDFSAPVDLMQDLTTQRPVATYIEKNSSFCGDECLFSLGRAGAFASAAAPVNNFFLLKDMILNHKEVKSFCPAWLNWFRQQPQDPNTCNPIPGPTATDYMTYLTQKNITDTMYYLVDGVVWGQRDYGMLMADRVQGSGTGCAFPGNVTNTTCRGELCLPKAGMDLVFQLLAHPPVFHVTVQYQDCFYGDWAVPFIIVQNEESQPLTFEISLPESFTSSVELAVVPPHESFIINIIPQIPLLASGDGITLSGNLTLINLLPTFSISRVVPFTAYNLAGMNVSVADTKLKVGDAVRITGNGMFNSTIQLLVPTGVPLGYLHPVLFSNGWVQSSDPVSPNVLIVDTSFLPAQQTILTLTLRQFVTLNSGSSFGRCWNYTVHLVANHQAQCSGTLTLSPGKARSGSIIQATLSPLTSNFDMSDTVYYSWRFETHNVSNVTTVPTATLIVPYLLQGNPIQVLVDAEDTYGRIQTCSALLTLLTGTKDPKPKDQNPSPTTSGGGVNHGFRRSDENSGTESIVPSSRTIENAHNEGTSDGSSTAGISVGVVVVGAGVLLLLVPAAVLWNSRRAEKVTQSVFVFWDSAQTQLSDVPTPVHEYNPITGVQVPVVTLPQPSTAPLELI